MDGKKSVAVTLGLRTHHAQVTKPWIQTQERSHQVLKEVYKFSGGSRIFKREAPTPGDL